MQLQEVSENSNLIFELSLNGQKFEFPSKCTGVSGNSIFAEPIKIDGRVLNFKSEVSVTINLVLIRKDKSPIVWKGIGVSVVMVNGKTMYKVIATADGFEMNRRGAFRLFVGISGVAQMGVNKKAVDVIVKDVSETGFAFVSNENIDNIIDVPIRLVFSDLNMNFNLSGICVRKVIIDENKIIYGCQLNRENPMLLRYISEKQRQLLSMNRNNTAFQTKQMLENSLKEPGITETEDDVNYKKKTIHNDGTHKSREINTVGKTERRDIFKDTHIGKKI